MKKIKFILSMMLVFLFLMQSVYSVIAVAATDYTANDVEATVAFSKDYAEVGVPLSAVVSGYSSAKILYEWYVDSQLVPQSGSVYVPKEQDLERYIKVKAYTAGGVFLCEAQMYFSRLPVLYIDTVNNEPVVSKDITLQANMKVQGNNIYNKSAQLYNGKTEIKGRGNSSWELAKKPYKLKLDKKTDMFGMGSNKHWVLVANYNDSSLMRDNVAYQLSGKMGMSYQDGTFVELILNGEYLGCYQFVEHIRVGDTRTNIFDWETCAEDAGKAIAKKAKMSNADRDDMIVQMTENLMWVTSNQVTYNGVTYTVSDAYQVPAINGGYLLEIDAYYSEISKFYSAHGLPVNINKPEFLNSNPTMMASIQDYFNAFENGLYSSNFTAVYQGNTVRYTDLIDLDSFVKGWLVNELLGNMDFGYKSTYMYKPIDGLLTFGPVWDMDWGSDSMAVTTDYTKFYGNRGGVFQWVTNLLKDPVFLKRAQELFWEYRYTLFEDIVKDGGIIDSNASYLKEAGNKNDYKWRRQMSNSQDSLHYKQWLTLRLECFDKYFETGESLYSKLFPTKTVPTELREINNTDTTRVKELEIQAIPAKTSYTTGEQFELTGLELKATYGDDTSSIVLPQKIVIKDIAPGEPKLVSADTAAKIPAFTDINKIEKRVTLYYKNKTVSYNIDIEKDFTAEEVQTLIGALPATVALSHRQLLSNAKKAYDSLSPIQQMNVNNVQKLTNAINSFTDLLDASPAHVYNAYTSGFYRNFYYSFMVIETNDSPENMALYDIPWTYFVNIPRTSASVTSIYDSEFGGEIWTVYFYNDTNSYGLETGNPASTDPMFNINTWSSVVSNSYKWLANTYTRDSSNYLNIHSYELAGNNAEIVTSPDVTAVELTYSDGYTETFKNGKTDIKGHRVWSFAADGSFNARAVSEIYATGISFNKNFSKLTVGGSLSLNPIYAPADTTMKGVIWTSSNPAAATVNSHGKVTAVAKGNTVITALSKFGGAEAEYNISVSNQIEPAAYIELSNTKLKMNYKSTIGLTAIVMPSDAVNKNVKWSSTNEDVCIVDSSGNVKAVGIGTAEIIATVGEVSQSCIVTVNYNILQWIIMVLLFGFLWY